MELVEYAKPSKILLFSSRVRDYFDKNHSIENTNREFICYKNEKRNIRYLVFKGELVVNSSRYPIFSLPHPNYQLRKELRDKAWKFCFK